MFCCDLNEMSKLTHKELIVWRQKATFCLVSVDQLYFWILSDFVFSSFYCSVNFFWETAWNQYSFHQMTPPGTFQDVFLHVSAYCCLLMLAFFSHEHVLFRIQGHFECILSNSQISALWIQFQRRGNDAVQISGILLRQEIKEVSTALLLFFSILKEWRRRHLLLNCFWTE